MAKHKHSWFHPHVVYEGRTPNEVGVIRYCDCSKIQMAFTKKWQKPPKSYDVSEMSLKEIKDLT